MGGGYLIGAEVFIIYTDARVRTLVRLCVDVWRDRGMFIYIYQYIFHFIVDFCKKYTREYSGIYIFVCQFVHLWWLLNKHTYSTVDWFGRFVFVVVGGGGCGGSEVGKDGASCNSLRIDMYSCMYIYVEFEEIIIIYSWNFRKKNYIF